MAELAVPGHGTIHNAVIADIRDRERRGVAEYGGPHRLHNGLDGLREAYEEALDMTFWLRQEIEERALAAVPVPVLEALASAWEDGGQAAETASSTAQGMDLARWHAGQGFALARCARMLREAITKGGEDG